jgi:hypothetical protein
MTIARAQMNRQLYQTGGNTLPIYPRIEAIETSLGGAEERIGDPALGQSSNSPLSNVYNNQTSGTGIGSIFGNTGGQQPNPIQPGGAVDPIGFNPPQQQGLQIINGVKQLPDPSTVGSNMVPRPMQPSSQIDPRSPRSLPFASAVGPSMQGVGDPRLGAATIPGNQFQMQMRNPQQAPLQQFSYGGRAGYQEGGRIGYQEGGIGMMQDQGMYNPLEENYYSGMPMRMARGGIANLVEREQYGIGSSLKKFVRKIIPNEVSKIATVAAPFVAPFNPALAAAMAGIGGFDQTGRIGSSLKSAALTYGAGQIARGIGGAGFQGNPFAGVDFSGGFTSGIGSLFSSPMGNLPFGSFSTPTTPIQTLIQTTPGYTGGVDLAPSELTGRTAEELQKGQLLQSAKELETGMGRSQAELIKTYGTPSGTGSTYGELLKKAGSFENVPLSERFNAVKDLSTKALKDIYTKPVINPKTGETTYALDKNALFSTFAGASSYYEALQLAKKAGVTEGEFSEADYQRLKVEPEKKKYTDLLKPESFGIRPQAAGGGLMNEGVLSIKLTPAQAMAKGGPMGSEIPVRQNQGGITELDLRAKGGYIPVGIKEKADDVPAMLSKNEFVFTADAVRGAGNGSINKGAQKMYKLMKSLEKKVKKTKVA